MPSQPSQLFANWGNIPNFSEQVIDFTRFTHIGEFDWSTPLSNSGVGAAGSVVASTMLAPTVINDLDGGGLILNNEVSSAVQNDFLQAQKIGASCSPWVSSLGRSNYGRLYKWLWTFQLSDAANCMAMLGVFSSNTNLLGTNIANGWGFMANLSASGAPAASSWVGFVANGSVTQFTTYNETGALKATDTKVHNFGIQLQTDANVLGAGTMTFWIDGSQIGIYGPNQSAVFPQVSLRQSFSVGNATAAAQKPTIYWMGSYGER